MFSIYTLAMCTEEIVNLQQNNLQQGSIVFASASRRPCSGCVLATLCARMSYLLILSLANNGRACTSRGNTRRARL